MNPNSKNKYLLKIFDSDGRSLPNVGISKHAISPNWNLKVHSAPYSAIVKQQETDVWAENEYGETIAEGNTETDCAYVINKALKMLQPMQKLVLCGEFTVNESITINDPDRHQNIVIEGGKIIAKGTDYPIIVGNGTNAFRGIHLKNIHIVGNGNSRGLYIRNGVAYCKFEEIKCENNSVGIEIERGAIANIFDHIHAKNNTVGLRFRFRNHFTVVRDSYILFNEYNIQVDYEGPNNPDTRGTCGIFFENCDIEQPTADGGFNIAFQGRTVKAVVRDCYLEPLRTNKGTKDNKDIVIGTSSLQAESIDVVGCYFWCDNSYGVSADYSIVAKNVKTLAIRDCHFYNVGIAAVYLGTVERCLIEATESFKSADYSKVPLVNDYSKAEIIQSTDVTKNSDTKTFSGDGSTKDFLIGDHGLVVTDPNRIVVKVTPISQDAINASPCTGYVDPNDNTKIRVKFASAPASGTDNVKIVWEAEVV